MTAYATAHKNPATAKALENLFSYDVNTLSAASPVPSDIPGTVNATVTTSRGLLNIVIAHAAGAETTAQGQQAKGLLFRVDPGSKTSRQSG